MPIYNKELFLERSISSIQKQSLKNLEILLVNDCSTDNSLKILKKFSKNDYRIKLINNDRNHGLLYSRAMGILNSTGEYLLNLDPDDMYSNKFVLEILYKKAKKDKTDLIIFKLKKLYINKIEISQLNKIIKDLNLNKSSPMEICNYYITNKFIKREIILKSYKFFKNKIYSNKWNYHEDNIWSKLITIYSRSQILLNKYIYLYFINKESLVNNLGNNLELKNILYRFETMQLIYKKNTSIIIHNLSYLIKKNKKKIIKNIEIKKKFIYLFIHFLIYYKIEKKTFLKKLSNKLNDIFKKHKTNKKICY